MITYKEVKEIVCKTCDKCKATYNKDGDIVEMVEFQEFLDWEMRAGYGSEFGDGNLLSLNLCQACQKEILGKYIQVVEPD